MTVPHAASGLASRAATGDQEAFGELLQHYDGRLRALAYALVGADAGAMEDVLQDAMTAVHSALPGQTAMTIEVPTPKREGSFRWSSTTRSATPRPDDPFTSSNDRRSLL